MFFSKPTTASILRVKLFLKDH